MTVCLMNELRIKVQKIQYIRIGSLVSLIWWDGFGADGCIALYRRAY